MFKKPSLISEDSHYYSRDPAFDTESEAWDHERLCETGDLSFAPRIAGGPEPTCFTLRPLTAKERIYCEAKAAEGLGMLAYWGVALALVSAAPMAIDDKPHEVRRIADGSITRVCDADMELIASVHDGRLLVELGERVWSEIFQRGK